MINIKRKETKSGLTVILLSISGEDGMLLPDLAVLLGVSAQNLGQLVKEHGLNIQSVGLDDLKELKKQKVIALKSARANFLPRSTVEALVKLVGTPEAWAIYGQLWDTAHAVHSGEYDAAEELVRRGLDASFMQRVADSMKALEEKVRVADKRAFSAMGKAAYVTKLNRKMDNEIGTKNRTISALSEELAYVTGNEWASSSEWMESYREELRAVGLADMSPISLTYRLKDKAKELGEGVRERRRAFTLPNGREKKTMTKLFNRKTMIAYLSEVK